MYVYILYVYIKRVREIGFYIIYKTKIMQIGTVYFAVVGFRRRCQSKQIVFKHQKWEKKIMNYAKPPLNG